MELLFSGKFSAERRQNLGFADRGRTLNLRQEGLEDRLTDATTSMQERSRANTTIGELFILCAAVT